MHPSSLVFLLGIICLVGGAFIYSRKEDTQQGHYIKQINDLRSSVVSLTKELDQKKVEIENLNRNAIDCDKQFGSHLSILEAFEKKLKSYDDELSVLKSRYHSLDKRIVEKNVNLNIRGALPIEVKGKKK